MSGAEKGQEGVLSTTQSSGSSHVGEIVDGENIQESWATRNGLTLRSFQKKASGADIELERPMKTRHLHMISIGEDDHGTAISNSNF